MVSNSNGYTDHISCSYGTQNNYLTQLKYTHFTIIFIDWVYIVFLLLRLLPVPFFNIYNIFEIENTVFPHHRLTPGPFLHYNIYMYIIPSFPSFGYWSLHLTCIYMSSYIIYKIPRLPPPTGSRMVSSFSYTYTQVCIDQNHIHIHIYKNQLTITSSVCHEFIQLLDNFLRIIMVSLFTYLQIHYTPSYSCISSSYMTWSSTYLVKY